MKRAKVLARYGDMRKQMGLEIKAMWFNLGQHKIKFIPDMVGNFLEMTLIPDIDLRAATIPIFFDMMQCEFHFTCSFQRVRPLPPLTIQIRPTLNWESAKRAGRGPPS